jgi:prenyltransferase beta subunit
MGYIGVDLLSNDSSSSIIDPSLLLNWCLQRQANDGGFQGRTNKPSDTCYAFWLVPSTFAVTDPNCSHLLMMGLAYL